MNKVKLSQVAPAVEQYLRKSGRCYTLEGKLSEVRTPYGIFTAWGRATLGSLRYIFLPLQENWENCDKRRALAHMLVGPLREDCLVFLDEHGCEGYNELEPFAYPSAWRYFHLVMFLEFGELNLERAQSEKIQVSRGKLIAALNRAVDQQCFSFGESWHILENWLVQLCRPVRFFTSEAVAWIVGLYIGEVLKAEAALVLEPSALPVYHLLEERGTWHLHLGQMVLDILENPARASRIKDIPLVFQKIAYTDTSHVAFPFSKWFVWNGNMDSLEVSPLAQYPEFTRAEEMELGEPLAMVRFETGVAVLALIANGAEVTEEDLVAYSVEGEVPHKHSDAQQKYATKDYKLRPWHPLSLDSAVAMDLAQRLRTAHLRRLLGDFREPFRYSTEQLLAVWLCPKCYTHIAHTLTWGKTLAFTVEEWRERCLEGLQEFTYSYCPCCGHPLHTDNVSLVMGTRFCLPSLSDWHWLCSRDACGGWREGWETVEYGDISLRGEKHREYRVGAPCLGDELEFYGDAEKDSENVELGDWVPRILRYRDRWPDISSLQLDKNGTLTLGGASVNLKQFVSAALSRNMHGEVIAAWAALLLNCRAERVRAVVCEGGSSAECPKPAYQIGRDSARERALWLLNSPSSPHSCACGRRAVIAKKVATKGYWLKFDSELLQYGYLNRVLPDSERLLSGYVLRCPHHTTEITCAQWREWGMEPSELSRRAAESEESYRSEFVVYETRDDCGRRVVFIGGEEAGTLAVDSSRLAGTLEAAGLSLPQHCLVWGLTPQLAAVSENMNEKFQMKGAEEELWRRYFLEQKSAERWDLVVRGEKAVPKGCMEVFVL